MLTTGQKTVTTVQLRFIGTENEGVYKAIADRTTNQDLVFPVIQNQLTVGSYTYGTAVTIQNLNESNQTGVTFEYTGAASCSNCGDYTYNWVLTIRRHK